MKKHWHWGTKLMLFMGLFLLMIIGFVYMSFQENFDLVEKDYYPKSLDYQLEIDKMANASKIGEPIRIEKQESNFQLHFPGVFNPEEISGQIYFYRPSNVNYDEVFAIVLDSTGQQLISFTNFQKGKYILKIDYKVNEINYLQKETVFVKMD